jgi:hypothetical protein
MLAGTVVSYAKDSKSSSEDQRTADFNHFVIFDPRVSVRLPAPDVPRRELPSRLAPAAAAAAAAAPAAAAAAGAGRSPGA